jgi:hypothetical protein
LTRHTGTLLIINNLRNSEPAHVPAQPGTWPMVSPSDSLALGRKTVLGTAGALDRPDAAGIQPMKGVPMCRLRRPCQQAFEKLICARASWDMMENLEKCRPMIYFEKK